MQVALKRIPDVLSSPELTKKVVREVCILRRLDHPFIISLRDAFIQPSSAGMSRPLLPRQSGCCASRLATRTGTAPLGVEQLDVCTCLPHLQCSLLAVALSLLLCRRFNCHHVHKLEVYADQHIKSLPSAPTA